MMMRYNMRKLALAALLAGAPGLALAADNGWQARVGEALGKAGSEAPGGLYRVRLPRTDLTAMLAGVELKAPITAASTSSAFPERNRSRMAGWMSHRRWARPMRSISSRRAAARRRSPAISC